MVGLLLCLPQLEDYIKQYQTFFYKQYIYIYKYMFEIVNICIYCMYDIYIYIW